MTRFIILYSVFIIVFGLFTTLLLLASPHHVDRDFLIIDILSLFVLPLTVRYLYNYSKDKAKSNGLIKLFLLLTGMIFTYYTYDVLKNSHHISWFSFVPITGLLLTLILLFDTTRKQQSNT